MPEEREAADCHCEGLNILDQSIAMSSGPNKLGSSKDGASRFPGPEVLEDSDSRLDDAFFSTWLDGSSLDRRSDVSGDAVEISLCCSLFSCESSISMIDGST